MSKPWEIVQGDVRKVMKGFASNSFDACLSDPPYGLSFMGKRWDYHLPSVNVWTELLRVLKPGAHAMLFGGTRTFHRLVVGVEDAGFEVRDLLFYLHGSGFPKSTDISKGIDKKFGIWRGKAGEVQSSNASMGGLNYERAEKGPPATEPPAQWQGWGSALKPATEPIALVRKYPDRTLVENVLKWGTGALNIDGGRIGDELRHNPSASPVGMWDSVSGKESTGRPPVGRWPANVMLDEEAAAMLDVQSSNRPGMKGGGKHSKNYPGGMFGGIDSEHTARGDEGGASRFFYTTKVGRWEREAGCEDLEEGTQGVGALRDGRSIPLGVVNEKSPLGSSGASSRRAGAGRTGLVHNTHATLKMIELTRWLATLLLPAPRSTPRRIVVPFSGAGSEMIGCLQAGWDEVVGIERETEYVKIATARITKGGVFSGLADKGMRRERARSAPRSTGLRKVSG